jgi:hypothetical protein
MCLTICKKEEQYERLTGTLSTVVRSVRLLRPGQSRDRDKVRRRLHDLGSSVAPERTTRLGDGDFQKNR